LFYEGIHALGELPDSLGRRLKPLVADAQNDVERLRTNVEAWYDDTMARVSGWYKRKTQIILIVIGVVLVPAINANTIAMAERMWKDDTVRSAVVAQAQSSGKPETPLPAAGSGKTNERILTPPQVPTVVIQHEISPASGADKPGHAEGGQGG
jgi:hypothetical protein